MDNLNEILSKEIEVFREQGHKFLNKELNVGQFKKLSGGMGCYAHRGGQEFMIRLRVPSGVAGLNLLEEAYNWAIKYNLDKVHLTTREAIQLHGISIDAVCDIMQEGLTKGIYTRGGGGNFPRNVALNPLSGVEIGEVFDVTPYALATNNHYMKKIYTYKLPRKIKTAFSNSESDAAHCTITDLGFLAVEKDGERFFKVYIGGGAGRNARKSVELDELIPVKDALYCVDAMINLFIAEGDYNNPGKARIRYIAERMGDEEFKNCFRKHLEEVKAKGGLDLEVEEVIYNKKGLVTDLKHNRLIPQKQEGLYSVLFHPIGGQLELSLLKELIDAIKNIEEVEVRLGMDENLYIRNLNGKEAEEILKLTQGKGGETLTERSVSCIGVPVCQMGVLESQYTLEEIVKALKENNVEEGLLPRIRISGCPNSCGMHQIGEIGFAGKKKKVDDKLENVFELHFGGKVGIHNINIGEYYGDILQREVPNFLIKVANAVKSDNLTFDKWIEENHEKFKAIFEEYKK